MLQPGTTIGRYQIQRKLARGGMGTVYVAHDPVLGRMVAVKVFVGDLEVPDAAERFSREARAAASLNHTNIVTIFDFGEVASQPYIVMEYIQGETITEIIRRRTSVPLSEKLRWLEELCAGAASAHKMDVVHRDIKPSNLMIDRSGRLKVLDFGIAKIVNSLQKSVTAVIGTPGYMAPEQLLGQPVDARTDIFAIGVVSFELLTYEEAFQGDSFTAVTHRIINEDVRRVADLVPDAPPDLCAIVEKSLQKNPADRYKDAESLRIALSRVRRRVEHSSDVDAASAQTIVAKMTAPVRRLGSATGTGTSGKTAPVSARTAELTPPPNPVAAQEALARAQQAKMQGALQRSEACLQNGEFERALAASQEVLEIEPAHAGAIALQQRITAAIARQHAAALLTDARAEFQRGALTRCKTLLDEARQLDPATHDATLERDLRLARVEQERKRHRAETVTRTVATARAAMERGDVEAGLALAREALSLDPNVTEARDIELTALRALEEGDDSRPTLSASADVATQTETTDVALPRPTPPPLDQVLEGETTVVALPWRTPPPTAIPVTPAPPVVPPLPPVPPPVPPSTSVPRSVPITGPAPVVSAPTATPATSVPRPVPTPAPAPPRVVPAPPPAPPRGATASAGTPSAPVSRAPAAPASTPPATPTLPSPSAPATLGAKARALPVQAWIDTAGSAVSQVTAKARALPRTQLLVIAGIAAVVLLVVAFLALREPGGYGWAHSDWRRRDRGLAVGHRDRRQRGGRREPSRDTGCDALVPRVARRQVRRRSFGPFDAGRHAVDHD